MTNSSDALRPAISGPSAWNGAQAVSDRAWVCDVNDADLSAIESGIATFARTDLPWQSANRDNLPLGDLGDLFARIRTELEEGTGLFRMRGLPVSHHRMEHLKAFYLSFGDHLGQVVSQSVSGQRLMDIEDEGVKSKDYGMIKAGGANEEFRSSRARAFSTGALRFHTDRCDVVSLMCIRQASEGGHSKIASAVAIHNAMLEHRPDLLEELFTPYPRSRFGEEVNDASAYYMLPVFAQHNGKFTTHYSRTYIEAAQSNLDVPRLRSAQHEALDLLAELANELCFEMTFQPGDIQLLNNHVVYHARDRFVDNAAVGQKRLLFRLWLAMGNSRPLPKSFEVLFGHTAAGALRGGIWPPDKAYQLPL